MVFLVSNQLDFANLKIFLEFMIYDIGWMLLYEIIWLDRLRGKDRQQSRQILGCLDTDRKLGRI